MSRYIDAEWLKQYINTAFWAEIGKFIDSAPSIDIVRCKECRYRKYRIDYEKEYCLQHSKVLYNTNGGCSWGKGADDEV